MLKAAFLGYVIFVVFVFKYQVVSVMVEYDKLISFWLNLVFSGLLFALFFSPTLKQPKQMKRELERIKRELLTNILDINIFNH